MVRGLGGKGREETGVSNGNRPKLLLAAAGVRAVGNYALSTMTKHPLKIALLLLLAVGLTYCAPVAQLAVGHYDEDLSKEFQWFHHELEILPNQRFTFSYVPDDNGGRHGEGYYAMRGHRLRLVCEAYVPAHPASIRIRPLGASHPDSVQLLFEVFDMDTTTALEPVPFVSFSASNQQQQSKYGVVSNGQGSARMRFAMQNPPDSIVLHSLGYDRLALPWPGRSTAYRIFLPAGRLLPFRSGQVIDLHVVSASPGQLVLRFGKHRALMKKTDESEPAKK